MLLTEEQAREKIKCPKPRATRTYEDQEGTTIVENCYGKCWASDCAMWRWHGKNCAHELPPKPSEASNLNTVGCDCPHKGYCGLAGKP